jgi:serine/threonine-protein kinase
MTPERWQQVKKLFHSALEREPHHRALFLDEACAGDLLLRREVESLITSHEQTGSFIDSPAYEVGAELLTEDQAELTAGQTIGHYEIIALLGSGGMGEVYLAQDTRLGRKIALKLLPTLFTRDEDRLRRFEQEARVASALNHPNICMIHDVGETEDGRHDIAMEYVDGVTLRQHLTETRMQVGEALDVVVQVASSLAAAHEAGIVHRDIKPENIILRRDGYIKVLDFGLAKLTDQQAAELVVGQRARVKTDTGIVMGTSSYMSPEQARGLEVDARTDVWSLGVVLYEMLAGCVPFDGDTNSDVIVAILDREPLPLEHYSPGLPARLQDVVSKALSKRSEDRYQTVKELTVDLRSLRQGFDSHIRNPKEAATQTSKIAARATSSLDHLMGGIKEHQRGVVLALATLLLVLPMSAYLYLNKSSNTIDSLAALPFVNADPNTEYLSDGITESLINSLSEVPDLKVISFSSVSRYKGQQIDPQAVGRDLGVRALLVGKVMQRGDDLLVSAELVDARDNRHIWGEQYNRKISGLLAIQKEISREISDKLRLRLSGEQKERLARRYSENTEAYQLYLMGRYFWNKWTPEGWQKSIEYFRQAIDKDPSYALAYVGLSDSYAVLTFYDVMLPREAWPKAEAAAVKALEIDDTLGEAHTSLGAVKYFYDWDWTAGERELKRGIELNPNYADAHNVYAHYLRNMGRVDEGLAEMKRAYELDPIAIRSNQLLGGMFESARQYDQAIEQYRKTLEMDPNYAPAHSHLADVYEKQGMSMEAIAEHQKAMTLSGDSDLAVALGQAYKASGFSAAKRVVWQKNLDKLIEQSKRGRVAPMAFAYLYIDLGEKEQAFEWLEKAYEERSGALVLLRVCDCEVLRSDPRFADLLRRIGLPQL